MVPVKLQQTSVSEMTIIWDDGHTGRYTFQTLRKYCPCAGCKAEIEARENAVLLPILTPGQYELRSIEPVGKYALQLTWGDTHRTGIYTFDYLRQLCECSDCLKISAE